MRAAILILVLCVAVAAGWGRGSVSGSFSWLKNNKRSAGGDIQVNDDEVSEEVKAAVQADLERKLPELVDIVLMKYGQI